jgi:lysyl-tRNA synthetase class 2
MLEWYEAYADYQDTMARIERLVKRVAAELDKTTVEFRNNAIDLTQEWKRISFVESLGSRWTRNEFELRERLRDEGLDTTHDQSWAQLIDHAFSHFVEPTLIQPTIVFDYPLELSPFARKRDDESELVERFEFFIGGMELGNAFTEINDSEEQRQRFFEQMGQVGGEQFDRDYVEALSYGMPPTGGIGLGIDRFAMLLSGKETIRDVILFPALRERQ